MTPGQEIWSELEDDGFIGLIGPVLSHSQDVMRYRFISAPKHKNRAGFIHGGMLMAFADRTMSTAARMSRQIRSLTTVQFDMHFISAARVGATVDIHCTVVRKTRTLLFLEGRLSVAGEIVATAKGVWKILGADRAESPAAM